MDESTKTKLEALRARLRVIEDLNAASSVLSWDQATYMPPKGGEARGRHLATLGRIAHERQVDVELGRLLGELQPIAENLPPTSDVHKLIDVARWDYERAICVPADFVAEHAEHQVASFEAWRRARPDDDFEAVRPNLERMLDLSRRLAEFYPAGEHFADPLLQEDDRGVTVAQVRALFGTLKERLVPLVTAVCDRPAPDVSCLRQHYPEAEQLAFGAKVIGALGYDFERGRQDKTHHPFMIRFGGGDVRITTRIAEDDLSEALFSTIHEAGHALYEQGVDKSFDGLPLGHGTSASVHESQSRLWENIVSRSLGFWRHFYPALQEQFSGQLESVPIDTFYRAINRVERSLIRTDADELTYNLHVMLRFELELDLLEGRIEVADLPEEWAARSEAMIGVRPPDHRDGVLQDVHWFAGRIGGEFQGYTLGNVMSAQFYEAALNDRPEIAEQIAQGRFDRLLGWLRENVHRPGRSVATLDLVEQATKKPLSIEPYMRYLTEKYGDLYGLGGG